MRVGVDARLLDFPGIGRYIHHLLVGLSNQPGVQPVGFVHPHQLKSGPSGPKYVTLDAPPFSVAEQLLLPNAIRRAEVELFHSPHFNFPWLSGVPLVVTIHDLAQLWYPGSGLSAFVRATYAQAFIRSAVRRAAMVITDSDFIRAEVTARYRLSQECLAVVPLAVELGNARSVEVDSELPKRFFLYVGTNKPWKNLEVLLRGLALASRWEPDIHLVVAGKQARNQEPLGALLRRAATGLSVTVAGTLTDDQLAEYYRRAVALFCPSVYEGFGLTALEGLACGCPVVHSGAASLPEVVGDAGMQANPLDPKAWCEASLRMWRSAEDRARLSEAGRMRAREFTVDRMAARTVEAYRRAIKQGNDRSLQV